MRNNAYKSIALHSTTVLPIRKRNDVCIGVYFVVREAKLRPRWLRCQCDRRYPSDIEGAVMAGEYIVHVALVRGAETHTHLVLRVGHLPDQTCDLAILPVGGSMAGRSLGDCCSRSREGCGYGQSEAVVMAYGTWKCL